MPPPGACRALDVAVVCLSERNLANLNKTDVFRDKFKDKKERNAALAITTELWYRSDGASRVRDEVGDDAIWEMKLSGGTTVPDSTKSPHKLIHPGTKGKRSAILVLADFVRDGESDKSVTTQLIQNTSWSSRDLVVEVGETLIKWKNN